jgi:NADPH:quinone reductase
MRAVQIERHGGPEVLELVELPPPEPAEGQLLVDVAAIGVNYRDVYEREGSYGGGLPTVIGAEGAGSVAATGERVAWTRHPGATPTRSSSTQSAPCPCRTA